jgi:inorganic pyrophosphatase
MDFNKIKAGKKIPEEINVFVEIPQGKSIKYELDKESGVLVVDRFFYTSMSCPFNYGFIPHTHAEERDPLDVVLIASLPIADGIVVPSRPIGLLEMEDENGPDNKIVALPLKKVDPQLSNIDDISDLNNLVKDRIKHFFESYKELEPNKWVKVRKFWSKDKALKLIERSLL